MVGKGEVLMTESKSRSDHKPDRDRGGIDVAFTVSIASPSRHTAKWSQAASAHPGPPGHAQAQTHRDVAGGNV